jgi:xanthine dehydrogenase accessory factor
MKELLDVSRRVAEARRKGQRAALATVFQVSGSTYRRPGARMLIIDDGEATGCVSGGCLERDVVEQARRALATGEARTIVYDSLSDGDIEEGFGQGCNGIVQVLVEPLNLSAVDHLEFISHCLSRRQKGFLATIVDLHGLVNAKLAQRLMASTGGEVVGDIADPQLRDAIAADIHRTIGARSTVFSYEAQGGRVEVFMEHIEPPLSLVVFGAGHDAAPLVQMAHGLGWRVLLVDHRPANIARARSLVPSDCVALRPQDIAGNSRLTARSAVVIMNHNYLDDLESLRIAAPSAARYVGVLGPRRRTERLLNDLRAQGEAVTAAQLERIYGPVGLDIGADDPNQIALAIVAEVHAVFADCRGGSLRDRMGPLHARNDSAPALIPISAVTVETRCAFG